MSVLDLIFETHAHYDHKQYDNDRGEQLLSLSSKGVGAVLNVGSDIKTSRASVALAGQYPFVYASVGVHPHDAKTLTEKSMDELKTLSQKPKVVAFGEIGLDFYRNLSPPDIQRKWFKRQLEVAWELQLPVIIHSRDADDEVYDILLNSRHRRGVIHAFPGDVALARRYIDLGFCLGIGGVLTYDKTGRLKGVVDAVPIEKLLLETDCPYLTPAPHRGKRNDSGYLSYVINVIAQIKDISPEAIRTQTYKNACDLWRVYVRGPASHQLL